MIRAVRPHGRDAVNRAGQLLQRISLVRLDDVLLDEAAALNPANLRSLDAIHLAAARALGHGLTAVITYDRPMADAADQIGLPVAAPA